MTIDEIFGKDDCKRILLVDVETRKRETKPLSSRPSLEAKLNNGRKPTESREEGLRRECPTDDGRSA